MVVAIVGGLLFLGFLVFRWKRQRPFSHDLNRGAFSPPPVRDLFAATFQSNTKAQLHLPASPVPSSLIPVPSRTASSSSSSSPIRGHTMQILRDAGR